MKLLFLCNSSKSVIFKSIQGATLDKIDRGETLVDIGAYCLMPNHFHLLIHEKQENGASLFMKKLATAYSMYFNRRHSRTGKLFEGVFRAEHADTDEYLKYLFSYIHLNPVKLLDPKWKESGLRDQVATWAFLKKYFYSSYNDYATNTDREETKILNRAAFPEYFQDTKEFKDNLNEWLNYNSA
ncbi:MAG: transposase [Patescibacteria group bacterium]